MKTAKSSASASRKFDVLANLRQLLLPTNSNCRKFGFVS